MKSNRLLPALNGALLALSAAGLAAWLTLPHANLFVDVCLPLSAVLFGLYLVLRMQEEGSALLEHPARAMKAAIAKGSSQRTR
jgi:hypothetical protein